MPRSPEQFNPKDEQYKEVADLPLEHQEEFKDVPEEQGKGFVRREALEESQLAEIASILKMRDNVSSMDILREKAEVIDYYLKEIRDNKSSIGHIKRLPEEIQADKQFILEAVKYQGESLKYVDKKFQADKEVVLEAIRKALD